MGHNTDPVRALIEKWRGTHGSGFISQGEFQAHLSTLRTCADELEAAIASAPPSAPVGVGVGCRHNFVRDEDHGGECCQKCGKVRIRQPAAPSGEAVAQHAETPEEEGRRLAQDECIGLSDLYGTVSYENLEGERFARLVAAFRDARWGGSGAIAAQQPAAVNGYIANVPDNCDRIVWRGSYYHLPPKQPAAVDVLAARLVDELDGLVGESGGVFGLHLNGDVATWEELLPGGRFERLSSLDELREALAAQQQGGRADG